MKEQAGALLTQAAGLVGAHTIAMGLHHGVIEATAKHGPITAKDLAEETALDPFYVEVWCRSAFGAGVLENGATSDTYQLAPHMATLLLDKESQGYVGGVFNVLTQPEVFEQFSANLASGDHIWWDQVGNGFIQGVADTGGAFNNRFIPNGMSLVPGVEERLAAGGTVLELSCGTGYGLVRLATHFPDTRLVGLDGDAYSLELAKARIAEAGFSDRIELVHSTMEDFDAEDEYDAVTINVSMHECRDIEAVTASIHRALKPGGFFLNSDFPFPDDSKGLRTVPGRVMSGIQYFEALINDQLLPIKYYLELLTRHGFRDVGVVEMTPVHAITYGTK
ncbi:MAG: class I SAM-dependent methyltransferase [Acidimicrobiia bacterium]|nr:MAG: class I SAM-dependent methyltransferase [Acidimicrobiia bacterium]